ncbi:MAG TPA: aryl-sulfate sulfotransferase, partial [Candidatus Kapabacteria bacterium]
PIATDAKFIILDSNFNEIGQVKAPSQYATKLHELLLLPNGHSMLLGRYSRTVDMSSIVPGGQTDVTVDETAIIEFDSSGNIVFEWKTEDHYQITDGTHEDFTAQSINYSFINALAIDNDGQLLASARRMDEITKIDRETGNIIWRLGGKNNQFTLIGDTTWFSHSHNIQALPNGHYILFDNGLYNKPKVSRGVEYALDVAAKTATQVWGFSHPDSIAGDMMGSIQRLDNGNTLIGWGTNTSRTCTEVTPDRKITLDMSMSGSTWSYRVYKAVRNLPMTSVKKEIAANVLGLSAFPNPTSSSTTLSYTIENSSNVSYSIIDALGRRVQNGDIGAAHQGTNLSSVSLSGLVKGVYTIQVHADGKTSASRLAVE